MLAFDPLRLSVAMIASHVVADSRVDAAVVEYFTVQNVRHRAALGWN